MYVNNNWLKPEPMVKEHEETPPHFGGSAHFWSSRPILEISGLHSTKYRKWRISRTRIHKTHYKSIFQGCIID